VSDPRQAPIQSKPAPLVLPRPVATPRCALQGQAAAIIRSSKRPAGERRAHRRCRRLRVPPASRRVTPPRTAAPPPLQDNSHVDLEALESENDRGIAALSERVGALRGITSGIHGEVESQHRLLDGMVSGNKSPPTAVTTAR
jgi:hypothetical protein